MGRARRVAALTGIVAMVLSSASPATSTVYPKVDDYAWAKVILADGRSAAVGGLQAHYSAYSSGWITVGDCYAQLDLSSVEFEGSLATARLVGDSACGSVDVAWTTTGTGPRLVPEWGVGAPVCIRSCVTHAGARVEVKGTTTGTIAGSTVSTTDLAYLGHASVGYLLFP